MFTIGTAGHVDHGKSTLVKALTGIDPDRLHEEKERGMTIDLGFAWLSLPSGREVSIVDVPGHERFIKNMLAGVGGIDLALLVVAADEGVMPQTEEHLAILDLLRVKRGVVVVTKKDLVEAEWLALVCDDLREHLKDTVMEGAPLVAVSAVTAEGLPDLLGTLDNMLEDTASRLDKGHPRLPIDRVFTMAGFGTVVTGTLIDGRLQVGQEVEVLPRSLKSRVRGLQTHRHKVEVAAAGSRVAVNLVGLATADLRRGDLLTAPRWLSPTKVLDVRLRLLSGAARPLVHNAIVSFHVGATESVAKAALLDKTELRPGESCWAQLRLADEVAVVKGDLFVIRTPDATVGGGEVVDARPKRHRRFQAAVADALGLLQRGTPEDMVLHALDGRAPLDAGVIRQRSGLPADTIDPALATLMERGDVICLGDYYASRAVWAHLVKQVGAILGAYHRLYPLRSGLPKEELKSKLGMPAKAFHETLAELAREQIMVDDDSLVHAAGHAVRLSAAQERKVEQLQAALAANRYAPPARSDLEQQFGLDSELLAALVEQGKLSKLGESIVFGRDVYEEMVGRVVDFIRGHGKITVAEVRDMFGTSRKYALALMEHLDERRVTRRLGDERVLR